MRQQRPASFMYSVLSGKSWTCLRGSTTMADAPVEQQSGSK